MMARWRWLLFLFFNMFFSFLCAHEEFFLKRKKIYPLTNEPIDVIIVCHPKDLRTLDLSIEGIANHIENRRRIIVVSAQKLTENAEWFDESLYPFSKKDVAMEIFRGDHAVAHQYISRSDSRIGWIYQQLLKLYAPFVIPDISSNMLVVDADTIFLRDINFFDKYGRSLYNPGIDRHKPYFKHAERLLPGFTRVFPRYSGISHHMLFQRPVLEDLFNMIRSVHNTDPWRALCRCIDLKEVMDAGISEYEIYFNFAFARTKQVRLRFLKWKEMIFNREQIYEREQEGYHYVSCHNYLG